MSWSSWLKDIHDLKTEDSLTYQEAAERLRGIAEHYEWYGKERFNERAEEALKEG